MRTIAVLRGGVGDEHEVSLNTGATVLSALQKDSNKIVEIFIDRESQWHVRGIPTRPEQALSSVDVVFNALHGTYGEDGEVQKLLERFGVPYTGSNALSSAITMNKCLTKEILKKHGVKMADSVTLSVSPDLEKEIATVFRSFPQPSVIKPANSGSSVGVTLAKNFDEFRHGIKEAFKHSKKVLVEEFIKGKEATVGVIDRLRGKEQYSLPPVEIIPAASCTFFDYTAKYGGESEERCPGSFSRRETEELQRLAENAHNSLGLRHYSRSDFIVAPDGIYFLETNTLPGLTNESLLPKSLAAVGVTMPEFVEHITQLALSRK